MFLIEKEVGVAQLIDEPKSLPAIESDTTRLQRDENGTTRAIAITFIVSCAVITLACVAALTISVAAFFLNAPW